MLMNSVTFRSFVKTATALRAGKDNPPDYFATRVETLHRFPKLAASVAGHINEIASLGLLGAPSAHHLMSGGKKDWSEKNKHRAEVAGLAGLAIPYGHDLAMKNKSYAGVAQRAAKHVPKFLRAHVG